MQMTILKRLIPLTALSVAVLLLLPGSGNAQIPLPLPTGTSTPTPTPTPTKSSTPSPTKTASPKPSPTKTTKPTSDGDRDGSTSTRTGGKTTTSPTVKKGLAAWLDRERTPARTTTRLLELIEKAEPGRGEPSTSAKRKAFGQFPVVGYVWYQDDYGAPRYFPTYHPHEGTDLFARSGTPVIAVTDGRIWRLSSGGGGGTAVWLLGDDGVRYYYGHLKSYQKGLRVGSAVRQGDVVGRVGATGDSAKGTYPHVHFEVNPGGRGTINPKPVLDGWLDAAEVAVLDHLGLLASRDALAPFGAARWGLLVELFAEPVAAPPALWAAAFDGSGTTLAYSDVVLNDLLIRRQSMSAPVGADGPHISDLLRPISFPAHDE